MCTKEHLRWVFVHSSSILLHPSEASGVRFTRQSCSLMHTGSQREIKQSLYNNTKGKKTNGCSTFYFRLWKHAYVYACDKGLISSAHQCKFACEWTLSQVLAFGLGVCLWIKWMGKNYGAYYFDKQCLKQHVWKHQKAENESTNWIKGVDFSKGVLGWECFYACLSHT